MDRSNSVAVLLRDHNHNPEADIDPESKIQQLIKLKSL